MKTYFQYQGHIKSHDVSLAISSLAGVGAQCGFGYAEIKDNTLTVFPKPNIVDTNKPGINDINDRIRRRRMLKPEDSGESIDTNFVCVARDGSIFSSDQDSIKDIPIRGTKGMLNEVFLFAVHTPVSEPINNPIDFVACWNESSNEFYELYKKTLDSYYPIPKDKRDYDIDEHSPYIDKFNFTALEDMVLSSSSYYQTNQSNAVLIAIYGTGTDTTALTPKLENFTIIPYKSQFPQPIPFNVMERNNLHQSIANLEHLTAGFNSNNKPGDNDIPLPIDNIKAYIDKVLADAKEELEESIRLSILPTGTIVLWEGSQIPKGWAEYTKAMGRIVIGHKPGGIQVNGKNHLINSGDMYNPLGGGYDVTINSENLPKHRHSIGINTGGQENSSDNTKVTVQSFDNRNTNLNGDLGDRGATIGVIDGAITSSYNLKGKTISDEVTEDKLVLEKLPPAVTLRYIIKIS